MERTILSAALGGLLLVSLANHLYADDSPAPTHFDTSHAWLLELPGIAGFTGLDRGMIQGLREGGYNGAVEVYDWPGEHPGLSALMATRRNHEAAAKVAKLIVDHQQSDPNGQCIIITHSAGAGICVWALEQLPKDVSVDEVLFVAPALSADYDLSKALPHVRGKVYAFTSPNDIVLSAGTRMFGTIDGKKANAAGLLGFSQPDGGSAEQYKKLAPMPYQREWLTYDNKGDHVGPMTTRFSQAIYCPLLKQCLPSGTANHVEMADKTASTVVIRPQTMPTEN